MKIRPDHVHLDDLKSRISEKLATYSRQAGSYHHSRMPGSAARLIRRGSLAAVIPLAAAGGDLRGQCITSAPYGQVILNAGKPTTYIAVGSGIGERVLLAFATAFSDLRLFADGPVRIKASGPGSYFSYMYAIRHAASIDITPPAVETRAWLCVSAGRYGNFCGGDAGFIGLQRADDNRLGWLDLSVASIGAGTAIVSVGARGFKEGPPTQSVHASNCAALLPVELVSFDAIITGNKVALSWETASELNNAGFELQRAAPDKAFQKVTYVEGRGTATDPHTYRFEDETVEPNAHYRYRLKQIDLDGTSSFSQIIEVFTEDPSQIALSEFYPNPANGRPAILKINLADQGEENVEVYDVRGSLVDSRSTMLNAGENLMSFQTNDLSAGMHFAKVQIGAKVLYRQFVVVK